MHEALLGYTSSQKATRLLALDDLWTDRLQSAVSESDRPTIVEVGHEIQALLRQLRDEVPIVGRALLQDREAFERAAEEAIRRAPITDDLKQSIRDGYGWLGWAAEVEIAFRYIEQNSEAEATEIARKVGQLLEGSMESGDLPQWFRCCFRVAIFGLTVGGVVLAGGGALLLSVTVASSVLGLADGLPGCQSDGRRSPSDAEEIERFAKLRRSGDITEREFRIAKRKILGVPRDEKEELQLDIEDFSPELKRPIRATTPFSKRSQSVPKPKPSDLPPEAD